MKEDGPVHCSIVAAVSNVRAQDLGTGMPARSTAELGVLFREHAPFIARSLRRLGVPAADVEDAVQEVFVVASRRIDTISAGAERSFLYGTAMRVASNVRRVDRRAQARRSDESLDDNDAEVDPGPTPEDLVDRRQARATLEGVLETMSVEMRAVFTLFELEEMTTNEIAALLGLPPGTVSSRLWRAREHFDRQVRELQGRLERKNARP